MTARGAYLHSATRNVLFVPVQCGAFPSYPILQRHSVCVLFIFAHSPLEPQGCGQPSSSSVVAKEMDTNTMSYNANRQRHRRQTIRNRCHYIHLSFMKTIGDLPSDWRIKWQTCLRCNMLENDCISMIKRRRTAKKTDCATTLRAEHEHFPVTVSN